MKSQIKISDPKREKRIVIETTAWIKQIIEHRSDRQPLLEQYALLITLASLKFLGTSGSFDLSNAIQQIYGRLTKEVPKLEEYKVSEQRGRIKWLVKQVIFNLFLDKFQMMIYLAARKKMMPCQEYEIDGVVQDVLIKIYNRLELLHGKSREELRAYLWKMIQYSCIDFWRDQKRRFPSDRGRGTFSPKSKTYQCHHQIDADYKDHLLSLLTPKQREVMELWIRGYGYQEIANLAGCSLASVKNLILRSRKTLRQKLLQEMKVQPAL